MIVCATHPFSRSTLARAYSGDVIMSIDNRDVTSATELAAIISAQTVGARVVFGVVRRGATLVLPLSVAARPLTAKTAS